MLVIFRKTNESLVVGSDIVITVLDVRGERIRLGIDAPANVNIARAEVLQALEAERRLAAIKNVAEIGGTQAENRANGESRGVGSAWQRLRFSTH